MKKKGKQNTTKASPVASVTPSPAPQNTPPASKESYARRYLKIAAGTIATVAAAATAAYNGTRFWRELHPAPSMVIMRCRLRPDAPVEVVSWDGSSNKGIRL